MKASPSTLTQRSGADANICSKSKPESQQDLDGCDLGAGPGSSGSSLICSFEGVSVLSSFSDASESSSDSSLLPFSCIFRVNY